MSAATGFVQGPAIQNHTGAGAVPRHSISMRSIERGSLFVLMASAFIAFIEPSPYEFFFAVALIVFMLTGGLRASPTILPLAACLFGFTLGGFFALLPFLDLRDPVMFVLISAYMSVATVVFAMMLRIDALGRLDALRKGYILAAVLASIAGIIGYFNLGGLASILTRYERATGTFKDPNVLGTFVILPVVYLVQSMFVHRPRLLSIAATGLILFGGVFLSFSRGAWIHTGASLALMTVLTFFTATTKGVRRRIIVVSLLGVAAVAVILPVALSFDAIGNIFATRASFEQSYDVGAQGRFGNQWASIPLLMERPNGFGPHQFHTHFVEDPHEVFLNAFASYGWLGGFSYLTLIVMTVIVGWRVAVARTPLQGHAIAIWSTLFVQIIQGLQIDTDHWRHFWLMLGLIWGILPALREAGRVGDTAAVPAAPRIPRPGLASPARIAGAER